jgi:hypothetical protein
VDGTDFRVAEPIPFTKPLKQLWYTPKFGALGVHYEVAVGIKSGDIVWYNGPFPCGMMQDITIFCSGLKKKLRDIEMIVADCGYCGDEKVVTPYTALNRQHRKAMSKARARHETINK